MLLGRPLLRDVKITHDWGSNIVTIQGNGIVRTTTVTKHLGGELRRPKSYCVTIIRMASQMKKNISFLL
jgi:hypothetical protein